MAETKICPKCSGNMQPGILQKLNNYGRSLYLWSPADDSPFPVAGAPSKRKDIIMYCCENCGFMEMYAKKS